MPDRAPLDDDALAQATWDDLAPLYRELLEAPIATGAVRAWLAAWSALDARVDEAYARSLVAYTGDTRDAAREAAYLRWASEIAPKLRDFLRGDYASSSTSQ